MSKSFIGIDNGVTGSIGVIYPNGTTAFIETPVIKEQSYTKEVQYIHRVKWDDLASHISKDAIVFIERPMVNPKAFTATTSALRALEATLIALQIVGCQYEYIDSKEWQKEFIGSNIIGHKELKQASMKIGVDLFPNHKTKIEKHGDADGLLIAEYCRRKYSQ